MSILKVGTYNIASCTYSYTEKEEDGRYPVVPERIGEIIKEIGPDICGLNEVYDKGPKPKYFNQIELIAKSSGHKHYLFKKSCEFPWEDIIGNAVVSNYKIVSYETIPVLAPKEEERNKDENEWYEDRLILKTVVDFNGRLITFVTTHFGLNLKERQNMVKALVKLIDETKTPLIVSGDFNDTPDAETLKPIYERLRSVADLKNMRHNFTFSSDNPYITIDYIFVSKEFDVIDFNIYPIIQSDHMPLMATLELKEN